MAWFGQHWIDDTIACIIRDEARKAGVPEHFALGIAGAESTWDPDALGDHGCSFGLFQLYTCNGQGQAYAGRPEVLYNPRLNAQVAMPPIASAYNRGVAEGLAGVDLVCYTARHSGHPGLVPCDDWRIQHIITVTLQLIFLPDGSWASWPAFNAGVCAGIQPPPPFTPARPIPMPDFEHLPAVEPPPQSEGGVGALPAVEPP